MTQVRIRTSDKHWAVKNAAKVANESDGYVLATISVPAVEHVEFAGRDMIRFDLGKNRPSDHQRWALYPVRYLVAK